MANGLLDVLSGALGTTPPAYLEGLLGQQATEDLRKRSIGSGLVNALVGYAAMPKNQNLGLGRILAGAAQAGMSGAQGVYDTALQDYQTKAKIDEMQRQKAIADREMRRQTEMEALAPQLIKTVPAQYREVQGQSYLAPTPAAEGATAPNFALQSITPEPTREMVTPEQRTIDMAVMQRMAGLSKDPLATLKTSAELVPALRKAGMLQTGQQDNPFQTWIETSQSPQVKKLASQYASSFQSGTIDQETADKRIADLAKAEDAYISRTEGAAARKAEADRQYELRQQLANNQINQQEFNRQIAQGNLALRQQLADQKNTKVLPPSIAKIESGHIDTAMGNVSLADKLDGVINNVVSSKIDLSPIKNTQLATQSALGSTNPDVMLYNQINEFKKQFTNMKLTLNKGTQTEGDAKRAMDEISNARSTPDLIRSLQDLRESYRKLALEENKTAEIKRKNFGATPEKGYEPFVPVPVPEYKPVVYSDQDPRYKNLPVGSVYINGKTGQAMTKSK